MKVEDYYLFQATARGLHTEEDVQRLVDEYGPAYGRIFGPWLPADRSAPIYEAACGNGIFLRWAQTQGYTHLQGSDLSADDGNRARAAGFDVLQTDSVEHLESVPVGSLQTIVAIDFIEHISKERLLDFLATSCRALQPGGSLILRAPNGDSPFVGRNLYNDITHVWAYTSNTLQCIGKMTGFRGVEFLDDTLVSIKDRRWLKAPLMRAAQAILRMLFRAAIHEGIFYFGSSFYVRMRK